MSNLGQIRSGTPRAFRDAIFSHPGQITTLNPEQSEDRQVRWVFHPDDITEAELLEFIWAVERREAADEVMEKIRRRVFGWDE